MFNELIRKARGRAGLTPAEALSLYDCGESVRELIYNAADELKEYTFGKCVTLSAVLNGSAETVVFGGNNPRGDLEAFLNQSKTGKVFFSREASLDDEKFALLCEITRLALPHIFIGINASEPHDLRSRLIRSCATHLAVGTSKNETDGIVNSLARQGIVSSFHSKEGESSEYRFLNSLLSMKEYLADCASMDTRIIGTDLILSQIYTISDAGLRSAVVRAMKEIRNGVRGVRL